MKWRQDHDRSWDRARHDLKLEGDTPVLRDPCFPDGPATAVTPPSDQALDRLSQNGPHRTAWSQYLQAVGDGVANDRGSVAFVFCVVGLQRDCRCRGCVFGFGLRPATPTLMGGRETERGRCLVGQPASGSFHEGVEEQLPEVVGTWTSVSIGYRTGLVVADFVARMPNNEVGPASAARPAPEDAQEAALRLRQIRETLQALNGGRLLSRY